MGIFDKIGFAPVNPNRQVQPAPLAAPRETIGPSPAVQRAAEQPGQQGGLFGMSPSQGLFQLYMQQLFRQKYAPPMMQGSPLQNFGGFYGFGSPTMPRAAPPQNPYMPTTAPTWDWTRGGPEPSGVWMPPQSQVNNG